MIVNGVRGNPYPNRYREKVEETLTEKEFLEYLEKAETLDMERLHKKENPECLAHTKIKTIKITALLATLYYLGIRVSEITGDKPRRYFTKKGEKWTKKIHGLRKRDIQITDSAIRVDPKEIRKHGKRDEPLWIPIDLSGAKEIVEQWEATDLAEDRVFPISKWSAWKFISEVTEGKLYPHYFRLNRATKFAEHEQTSILDLQQWFGWISPRTIQKYMGKAGRVTRKMAERLRISRNLK